MGWDCSIDSSISEFLVYPLFLTASSLHYHNNQEFTVYTSLLKIPPAYQYNLQMEIYTNKCLKFIRNILSPKAMLRPHFYQTADSQVCDQY